ncbi:MAG TPA: phosphate/phosphite/phosphonate ABC transporter substrate-binding protein [Candidatus Limnocylindria bacterium]|nr:phosphate/phosphite/phosphonate ABC transporter substrate-binding protein [Candidatus Limnocylindria bacterium]
MLSTRGRLGWALAVVLLISACTGGTSTSGGAATGTPAASKTPRIGSFDRPIIFAFTPSADVARITAAGNAIASALASATGLRWKVTVPTSYAAEIESVCSGQTDIAAIAPLQMTLLLDKQCGDPILSALRKDDTGKLSTTYQSQIIVKADSGITDINGLKGKKFAFTDPISTSGYLFPTLLVKQKTNQDPKTFFGSTIFAGGHDKSVLAVYSGQVDGAASFIDARTLKGMPDDILTKTKRIETAGPIPNDGIAIRKGFPADVQAQVTKALIDYCASDAGKVQCKNLFSWDGLQQVDKSFYDPVKDAAKLAGIDVAAEAAKTPTPPATPKPSPSKAP